MKNTYKNWDQNKFFSYMKRYNIPYKKEIKRLSTGMKKKIEIAVALSHNPKLLILDEPTSGLDPVMRSEILDLFEEFVENKENSILLSTHITSDLEHIADDVIFISNGEIIFNKPLKEIKNDYILLELSKDEFESFDKNIIIRYKKNRLDYQILINKKDFKKSFDKYIKGPTTLDDIMLLYIRGAICGD
jgi:ABC-2 type transport system ATP-binding protein